MRHHSIASLDFSKRTLSRLSKLGVFVVGIQMIPNNSSAMPWANAEKAYVVSERDCGKVLSFREVLALANGADR